MIDTSVADTPPLPSAALSSPSPIRWERAGVKAKLRFIQRIQQ